MIRLGSSQVKKVAFLDRDGTLIWEPTETYQIDSIEKLQILPGVIEGLQTLIEQGFDLVMASNQDGLGTKSFPQKDFNAPHNEFLRLLKESDIVFDAVCICPHFAEDNCDCRKPKIGIIKKYLDANEIDLDSSIMIGDRATDGEFATNMGIRFLQVETNGPFPRFASCVRATNETNIRCFVNLDGMGKAKIQTGIGFLDHMLELLTKHSLIDLELSAIGDLNVDEHHTVEDTALVLGTVLSKALSDKRGITRYGFLLPMDEALAEVALDLSGRPYCIFEGSFKREYVGELPTELVPHFFESLAQTLKCNLHMTIKRGENEHHKIEALFKGLGRCLRQAFRYDRFEKDIPSTKGSL